MRLLRFISHSAPLLCRSVAIVNERMNDRERTLTLGSVGYAKVCIYIQSLQIRARDLLVALLPL